MSIRRYSEPLALALMLTVHLSHQTICAEEPEAQGILVKPGQKIAYLGDSITARGVGPVGYVSLIMAGLKANGIEATAIGAGVSGHKSNQILERLDRDVISKKPDWMTLSCGVNDVWHGANGVPLEQYKTNITSIVEKAQAAGIKVVILTATVIGEELENPNNAKLVPYNEFLRVLANEKHCQLADLSADFQTIIKAGNKSGRVLTYDGVHMNPAGDQVMAKGVLRALGTNEKQLEKAAESWLDIPNAVEFKPVLQGVVKITLRQYQKMEALATKYNTTTDQLLKDLYSADLFCREPLSTRESIETYLNRKDRKDASPVLQDALNGRVDALTK